MDRDPAHTELDERPARAWRARGRLAPGPRASQLEARLAGSPDLRAALERQRRRRRRAQGPRSGGAGCTADAGSRPKCATPRSRRAASAPRDRRRAGRGGGRGSSRRGARPADRLGKPDRRRGGPPCRAALHRTGRRRSLESRSCSPPTSRASPSRTGAKEFGWRQAGIRSDRLGNREARTVLYEHDGKRIAYTIVSGDGIPAPSDASTTTTQWRQPARARRPRAPGRHLVARRPDLRALRVGRRRPRAAQARLLEGRRGGAVLTALLVQGEERRLDPETAGDHIDKLFRAACAMCGSRDLAEDLVQETYVKVLSRPRLLRRDDDLGYLVKALRNTWYSHLRDERIRRAATDPREQVPEELAARTSVGRPAVLPGGRGGARCPRRPAAPEPRGRRRRRRRRPELRRGGQGPGGPPGNDHEPRLSGARAGCSGGGAG